MAIAYKLGRATRAIWNGPFYIGKLAQPASVGDVLLKVLETIWRTVVALILLIAIGLGIGGLWVQLLAPLMFPPLKDQIVATAIYDVEGVTPPPIVQKGSDRPETKFRCTADYPLKVIFRNRSSETAAEIGFAIEARRSGYSKNLVSYSQSTYENDYILRPGRAAAQCWSLPGFGEAEVDPSELEYGVKIEWAYPKKD